jgi:hypothetical protein
MRRVAFCAYAILRIESSGFLRHGSHVYAPRTLYDSQSSPTGLRFGHVTCLFGLTKETKLRGLSLRANYTDRATASCRRS